MEDLLVQRRRASAALISAAFVAVAVVTAGGRAVEFTVTPAQVLIDESATVHVSGLAPGERVAIRADLVDGAAHQWASEAEFVADAAGAIDTSALAPVKGSYSGVSSMGLIWSMKPAQSGVVSYQASRDSAMQLVTLHLQQGGRETATARLEQLLLAADIRQIRVEGDLHGTLFVPGSAGPHPGVLVVGGSEGGVPREKAAWLASHGYAALALAYFHYENLPAILENIPLEYFGRALAWMAGRPEIDPARLAVVGTSRGGELALQLGSMYPDLKAVVAYVPANVRYPSCCTGDGRAAWTWHGQPLAFVSMGSLRRGLAPVDSAAEIAVERTNGPLLLISGGDDGVWSSSTMATAVVSRLKAKHFTFPVEQLNYAHAGHRSGRPEIVPAWHGMTIHPLSGRPTDVGGTAAGDAASSIDAIPKVLAFLQHVFDR